MQPPRCLWGGVGSGATCAICSERVDPKELEVEVEFDPPGPPRLWFHNACYQAWQRLRLHGGNGLQLLPAPAATADRHLDDAQHGENHARP